MPLAEAVKYVAAAYGVILAVLIAYTVTTAWRIAGLRREVQALDEELERREAAAR